MMKRLASLLFLIALTGCQPSDAPSDPEIQALKARLAGAAAPGPGAAAAGDGQLGEQTRDFYQRRQYQPVWIIDGKARDSVATLGTLLAAAGDDGLDPWRYDSDSLRAQIEALKEGAEPAAATELELALTAALLRYGSDLALGRPAIARQIDADWTVSPRTLDVVGIVLAAVADKQLAALPVRLAPPHAEYARLKAMLQRYRKIAAEGRLQPLAPDMALNLGQASPGLAALRDNLRVLGDLADQPAGSGNVFAEDLANADAEFKDRHAAQPERAADGAEAAVIDTYDAGLADAVRRFESRHGLNPDGLPDPAMIAAMNLSAQARADQLALNLERWRWLPAEFGTPHIFVNIPGFSLQVRGANATVPLKMRVIVGKGANPTPIFSDSMTKLVFSPYWNIPQSIEVKEMLPLISKDSNYLNKNDIEVVRIVDGRAQVVDPVSIDWANATDAGDFQLRQRPGGDNALGFVKFLFPNRHQVYLHDTPSDNLFNKLTRDLSHGCVRLEQPVELAAYVLRDQPEWTAARIQAAMHAGKEEHVALTTPIAVHLVYLTARVDEDGVPQFFDDVYGYDGKQQELSGASERTGAGNAEPAHDVATGR